MKKGAIFCITILFSFDLVLLVAFGKPYTKLIIFPPFFYVHELILLCAAILSLFFFRKENRVKSIEVMFLLSLLYLIWSFFKNNFVNNHEYYVLRQFMIFGYGLSIYFIMNSIYSTNFVKQNSIKSIKYFGVLCIVIQVIYIFYNIVFNGNNSFFERNYYSPIIIMGLYVVASYVLVYIENIFIKNALFLLVFIVSLSTGHDSAYLSLGLIYFAYLFIMSKKKYKIVLVLGLLISIVSVFVFFPSFTDVNVQWRILFWKDVLIRITNNYLIFGDGFGIPYASMETVQKLNEIFPSNQTSLNISGNGIYLTAPHNSFLSMAIHTGIFSLFLLFYSLKDLLFAKSIIQDKEILLLSLTLLGIVVFSSFNVVLELPHSSSIFWMVFFILIFKLTEKRELSSKS